MRIDRTDYDYNPSYKCGYDDGYDDGYNSACKIWQTECKQLRDTLRAMLDVTINGGEAPAPEVTE